MRDPITLGLGIAPDVAIVDGLVYVAYGVTDGLTLVVLTLEGVEVRRHTFTDGFDQSFPRFSGPWLAYRQNEAHGYAAAALNVRTGQAWTYTAAGGTFCLTANAELGLVAYEWKTGAEPWRIWFGNLANGLSAETPLLGAPDGLDQFVSVNQVTLRKDTRGDVPGIWYPVRAGDLTVGELRDVPGRPNGGIGVQLAGDVLRVALPAQNTPTPRCATDGAVYAVVCWGEPRHAAAEVRRRTAGAAARPGGSRAVSYACSCSTTRGPTDDVDRPQPAIPDRPRHHAASRDQHPG